MIYPKYLKHNDSIGITAISSGITEFVEQKRLDFAIQNLKKRGYNVIETEDVRTCFKGKSTSSKIQAKELMELYEQANIRLVICASGGDFLLEMLDDLDWNIFLQKPKWIQGYSDITSLLYILTTKYDIATLYANTIKTFGMKKWHSSLENNFKLLEGKDLIQESFDYFEKEGNSKVTGNEEYYLDTKVLWKTIKGNSSFIEGRFIGGCIDVLLNLVGTKYDCTADFLEKYKSDGFIWYFDNAELSMESLIRGLWQLKNCGWFQYVKAFLFGRMFPTKSYYDITKEEAVLRVLSDFDVPIIMDVDFGHIPPRMTIINGAVGKVSLNKNKGKIEFNLER